MNTAPISQRPMVTCYVNYVAGIESEDAFDCTDVYAVFPSGVVMYNEFTGNYLEAMNIAEGWTPSGYGEQHVRDIFEFIGYFPAPCTEQI